MRDAELARNLEHHKKLEGRAPWRPHMRLGATFDEGLGTGVSQCFRMTKPMPPRKKVEVQKKKLPDTPWRPAGAVPERPPLEYREDPYGGYDPREPPKKKHGDERAGWRPSGATNSSWYTQSIAFKKL